jgi:hypothetical protein
MKVEKSRIKGIDGSALEKEKESERSGAVALPGGRISAQNFTVAPGRESGEINRLLPTLEHVNRAPPALLRAVPASCGERALTQT